MKNIILSTLFILWLSGFCYAQENKYVKLSQEFLEDIKENKDYNNIIFLIECINPDSLKNSLNNDNLRKAFWINMYNGLAQITIDNKTGPYNELFYEETWMVANRKISLQQISNTILRHSKISTGYEKKYRLDSSDTKIPFALNFCAIDCPAIHIFSSKNVDTQLNGIADNYIHSNCKWDDSSKTLYVPQLFEQYYSDFKRHNGINSLMIKYGIIPVGKDYDNFVVAPFNAQMKKRNFAVE